MLIDATHTATMPVQHLPLYRNSVAVNAGVERNILVTTYGGIGDHICAEPTLRYIVNTFKDCRISLGSIHPELFGHIPFDYVYDLRKEEPFIEHFLKLDTYVGFDDTNVLHQLLSHTLTHCVDFSSICALRRQLPVKDREIVLRPPVPTNPAFTKLPLDVVIHPGRHWLSKTFPDHWWNDIIMELVDAGVNPIIVGADRNVLSEGGVVVNQGTVDIDTYGCVDLRDRTSMMEVVWLCQNAKAVITNDSAPLHMAASGDAWIHFLTASKHPDMITHWRHGEFGWHMKNHSKGGLWQTQDYSPYNKNTVAADYITPDELYKLLPDPRELAKEVLGNLG